MLVTGHRRENFGNGYLNICDAISAVATKHPNVHFIYPVHLNPNVQKPVNRNCFQRSIMCISSRHLTMSPLFISLNSCYLVLTDSGGIQEEAPSLGKPVLVMRDVTERPEAVDAGTVILVGANKQAIVSNLEILLTMVIAIS